MSESPSNLSALVDAIVKAAAEKVVERALASEMDAIAEAARPMIRKAVADRLEEMGVSSWELRGLIDRSIHNLITFELNDEHRADLDRKVRDAIARLLSQEAVNAAVKVEMTRRVDEAVAVIARKAASR